MTEHERRAFVDHLVRAGALRSPAVEAAFRAVPREVFLPGLEPYRDEFAVVRDQAGRPVGAVSQPSLIASMLEQLGPAAGHRVLEVGAGTGYTAALLARIVGPDGAVVTVEIDAALAERARANLARAGARSVAVTVGDGGYGVPDQAPFDRILLTVGASDLPPPLVEQLAPRGRLVAPLWLRGAWCSIAFDRVAAHLVSASVVGCHFTTRLRGAFEGTARRYGLGAGPDVWVELDDGRPVDARALWALLSGSWRETPTEVWATAGEVFHGLFVWLALAEPYPCQVETAREDLVPALVRLPGKVPLTAGALPAGGLALLARSPAAAGWPESQPFEVTVRAWGRTPGPARRVAEQVAAWHAADRRAARDLRVRACAAGRGVAGPGEYLLRRRWTDLVLAWSR